MKHSLFFIVFLCAAFAITAQETFDLWPDGAPDDNGHDNIAQVTLFRPKGRSSGTAAVICPGGGYWGLAMDHEGYKVAELLAENGITAMVLKYRMPHGNHLIPAEDARRAIKLMRENAVEWGIDPAKVGIIGSSAGGHLASTVSTHFPDSSAVPDFAVLLYPVISMRPEVTHKGSADNLLGERVNDSYSVAHYSNDEQVSTRTPPTLILLSSDDALVPPENSLRYFRALLTNGVSAEMHIYPTGDHGWGMRTAFPYYSEMTQILLRFLMAR